MWQLRGCSGKIFGSFRWFVQLLKACAALSPSTCCTLRSVNGKALSFVSNIPQVLLWQVFTGHTCYVVEFASAACEWWAMADRRKWVGQIRRGCVEPTASVRDEWQISNDNNKNKARWEDERQGGGLWKEKEREKKKSQTKRNCGRVEGLKRNRVNKACKNIISPDQAAALTTTANNESNFISRADKW